MTPDLEFTHCSPCPTCGRLVAAGTEHECKRTIVCRMCWRAFTESVLPAEPHGVRIGLCERCTAVVMRATNRRAWVEYMESKRCNG